MTEKAKFRISDFRQCYDGQWKVWIDDLGFVDVAYLREVVDLLDQLNAGIDPWDPDREEGR